MHIGLATLQVAPGHLDLQQAPELHQAVVVHHGQRGHGQVRDVRAGDVRGRERHPLDPPLAGRTHRLETTHGPHRAVHLAVSGSRESVLAQRVELVRLDHPRCLQDALQQLALHGHERLAHVGSR